MVGDNRLEREFDMGRGIYIGTGTLVLIIVLIIIFA